MNSLLAWVGVVSGGLGVLTGFVMVPARRRKMSADTADVHALASKRATDAVVEALKIVTLQRDDALKSLNMCQDRLGQCLKMRRNR